MSREGEIGAGCLSFILIILAIAALAKYVFS
jgi:hypothetical protein